MSFRGEREAGEPGIQLGPSAARWVVKDLILRQDRPPPHSGGPHGTPEPWASSALAGVPNRRGMALPFVRAHV